MIERQFKHFETLKNGKLINRANNTNKLNYLDFVQSRSHYQPGKNSDTIKTIIKKLVFGAAKL